MVGMHFQTADALLAVAKVGVRQLWPRQRSWCGVVIFRGYPPGFKSLSSSRRHVPRLVNEFAVRLFDGVAHNQSLYG